MKKLFSICLAIILTFGLMTATYAQKNKEEDKDVLTNYEFKQNTDISQCIMLDNDFLINEFINHKDNRNIMNRKISSELDINLSFSFDENLIGIKFNNEKNKSNLLSAGKAYIDKYITTYGQKIILDTSEEYVIDSPCNNTILMMNIYDGTKAVDAFGYNISTYHEKPIYIILTENKNTYENILYYGYLDEKIYEEILHNAVKNDIDSCDYRELKNIYAKSENTKMLYEEYIKDTNTYGEDVSLDDIECKSSYNYNSKFEWQNVIEDLYDGKYVDPSDYNVDEDILTGLDSTSSQDLNWKHINEDNYALSANGLWLYDSYSVNFILLDKQTFWGTWDDYDKTWEYTFQFGFVDGYDGNAYNVSACYNPVNDELFKVSGTQLCAKDVKIGIGKVNKNGNDKNVIARTEYVIQSRTSKSSGKVSKFVNGIKPLVQFVPVPHASTVYDIFLSYQEPAASVINSHDIQTYGNTYDIQKRDFDKVQRSSMIDTGKNILYKSGDKTFMECDINAPDKSLDITWEYSYTASY